MAIDVANVIFGTDHASHQGRLTAAQWVAMAEQEAVAFTLCKATGEGAYFNPTYFPNRDAVRAANLNLADDQEIRWGSYDWVEPSEMSLALPGEWHAEDYLRSIGPRDPGHLLMVDFESPIWDTGPLGRSIEEQCRRYFMTLSEKSGQLVGVYYGPYFPEATGAAGWDWLGDTSRFYCWLAAPGPKQQLPDNVNWPADILAKPLPKAVIHQHDWHASFASIGVPGEWDRNRFLGTRQDLAYYGLGGNTMAQQVPLPPDGKWSADVTEDGKAYLIWSFGGKTTPDGIVGVNIQDMGMTVKSFTEPGMVIDASVKENAVLPYNPPRPQV